MKYSLLRVSSVTLLAVLCGCSGNSSSTSQSVTSNQYVNGYIGASNIHNALVRAVPVDLQGQPETRISDDDVEVYAGEVSTSTSLAYYSVKIDSADIGHPVILIALGKDSGTTTERCQIPSGCAADWSYKSEKVVDGEFERRASVGEALDNMRINVNWVTHLASAFAYTSYIDTDGSEGENPTTPKAGIYTPLTIERANLWMNRMFGVVDIISSRALEPAALNTDSGLSSALLPDAIYYGALVAAGQQLAKDQGLDTSVWLQNLVYDVLHNNGQLYQKGGSGTSLYDIFAAAYQVLSDNRDALTLLNYQLPSATGTVLARLQQQMSALHDDVLTDVDIPVADVEGWLDRINNAKTFVTDLNERLINYKGQSPDTCPSSASQDDDTCVHSFVDPSYVAKTVAYYDSINQVYESVAPGLNVLTQTLRDLSFDFIACLNGGAGCNSARYNDTDKTYTVAGQNGADDLVLSVAPVEVDDVGAPDGEYYAFDIIHEGTLTVNYTDAGAQAAVLTVTFSAVTEASVGGSDVVSYPRLRIVYDGSYPQVPLTAVADSSNTVPAGYIEPLGFDLSWPEITLPVTVEGVEQTFSLYVTAKLIGVKDILAIVNNEPEGQVYHYNLTEAGLVVLATGADEGKLEEDGETVTLADQSEFTLSASTTNASNYYSDSVWPELDDFFRVRSGFETGVTESGMFEYRIAYDQSILFGTDGSADVYRTGDYIDVEIKGYGINRLELFADDDVGTAGLRKCSVTEDANDVRTTESCTSVLELDEETSIQQLIDDDLLGLFSVPGRGAYRPLFNVDGDGKAVLQAVETLDGRLDAVFTQGLEELKVRQAHELVECRSGDCLSAASDNFSRLPLALVDMTLSRKTKDIWDVGITAGYDYDYLVDILPTGSRAQSLYLAYAVGQDSSGSFGYEFADLIVFRGGVTLFSSDSSGQSIGLVASGDVSYGLEYQGDDDPAPAAEPACGVINRKEAVTYDCDAVGYLIFRNSLVGVIREERDGIYVVRFSDGQFVILGG